MDAPKIIKRFGGQSALAYALDKHQSTVQYWARTGSIPHKWHAPIIQAAKERGIPVGPGDFTEPVLFKNKSNVPGMPEAKWPGALEIGEQELNCYVLADGRRVISRTGALNFLTGGKGGGNLESYLKIEGLQSFLPQNLEEQFVDFRMLGVVNKNVKGLSASAFIDICRAYARAKDTGSIKTVSQIKIAVRASILLAAFAKTGIEAAIDEATGYQYERAQDALRMKLQLFLEDEMRAWEKTFPDELWVQFGRLTRWKKALHQRPKYWGKLVMELIYGYLDPDVSDWLKENAPKPRAGQNYHQWLSSQYGLKKLVEHIWLVIGMASACHDMAELRQKMAEKFGREGIQLTLYLPPPL